MKKRGLSKLNTYLWFALVLVIGLIAINEYFRFSSNVGVQESVYANTTRNVTVQQPEILEENYTCYNCYSFSDIKADLQSVIGRPLTFNDGASKEGTENKIAYKMSDVLIATFFFEPYYEKKNVSIVMFTNITDESKSVSSKGLRFHVFEQKDIFESQIKSDALQFEDLVKTGGIVAHLPTGIDKLRWFGFNYSNHTLSQKMVYDSVEEIEEGIVETTMVQYSDYDVEFVKALDKVKHKDYREKKFRYLNYMHSFAVRCNPLFIIYVFSEGFDSRGILSDDDLNRALQEDRDLLIPEARAIKNICEEKYSGVELTRKI